MMLIANTKYLARIIHRRVFIVLAIVQKRLSRIHSALCTGKDLKSEARVLEGRSWSRKKRDVIGRQKVLTIQCRPNGRLGPECVGRIDGPMNAHADQFLAHRGKIGVMTIKPGTIARRPIEPEIAFKQIERVVLSLLNHKLKGIGIQEIIRLENGDVLTARDLKTAIH